MRAATLLILALLATVSPARATPPGVSAPPADTLGVHVLIDGRGARILGVAPGPEAMAALRAAVAQALAAPVEAAAATPDLAPPRLWDRLSEAAGAAAGSLAHGRIGMTAAGFEIVGAPRDAAAAARVERIAGALEQAGVDVRVSLLAPAVMPGAAWSAPFRLAPCGGVECRAAGPRAPMDLARQPLFAAAWAGPPAPDAAGAPAWLEMTLADGALRLRGAAPDAATAAALRALADARLPGAAVEGALREGGAATRPGWRAAALASVDALAPLAEGRLLLRDRDLTLEGVVPDAAAAQSVEAALAPLREAGWRVRAETRVVEPQPARDAIAPCAERLSARVAETPLRFEVGDSALSADSAATVDALAAILRDCAGGPVEIGGHTDAQGAHDYNMALSTRRAAAVRAALIARGVPPGALLARGYGPTQPVADNATEAGRAKNRRIAFTTAATPASPRAAGPPPGAPTPRP